ncbi:MAG: hypothetical protein U0230_13465 [Polyangiales bacterium]
MTYRRLDPRTEEWLFERCRLVISAPARGVVLQRFIGHATPEVVEPITSRLERAVAQHGTLRVFDDWEEATGYESEVRVRLTEWTKRHREAIPLTHILVRSKLLAMGLSVANLAIDGGLEVHTTRAAFERELAAAVQAATASAGATR